MSNPRNFGDLARALTAYLPNLDASEARRRINNAYVNEAMGHSWSFLIKRFTLQTEPAYNTGTLSVSPASTAVTLSGGTWATGWTTTPSMRRLAIQGRFESYDITIGTTTTGTIADPWMGGLNAAATYNMWRDEYPFPADCGYAKLMGLYDPEYGCRLEFMSQPIFIRELMGNVQLVNIPYCFTIVDPSTETPPRARFRMYPPDSISRTYWGFYFARPNFMATDAEYPRWPHEAQDMLPLSAAIEHYSTPRFYSPKYLDLYKTTYADLYAKAIKAYDGDVAIDHILEDVRVNGNGRGRKGNAWWSPNVMGFSGSEMTRS